MTPLQRRQAAQSAFSNRGSLPGAMSAARATQDNMDRLARNCERLAVELETMARLGVTARRQLADEERRAMKSDAEIRALMFPAGQEARP